MRSVSMSVIILAIVLATACPYFGNAVFWLCEKVH